MDKSVKKRVEWYNDASTITTGLIGLIIITILLSQSFAIKNGLSAVEILSSILTHNSIYLCVCLYFIALKTKFGKKYFDHLNVVLILFYLFTTFTSFLTVFQSFNLDSLMSLFIHVFIVLYLVHTFFRGTRIWKEFKLSKSPFNEFSNEGYFYTVIILGVILLAINLIMTTSFHGTVLSLLDCSFTYLFARYIYLYWQFLDMKKIDCKNTGNFDKITDTVVEEVKEKVEDVKEVLDKVSDKFEEPVEKLSAAVNKVEDKVEEFTEEVKEKVEELKIDEKIDKVKDSVEGFMIDMGFDDDIEKAKEKVEDVKETALDKVESIYADADRLRIEILGNGNAKNISKTTTKKPVKKVEKKPTKNYKGVKKTNVSKGKKKVTK